MQFSVSHVGLTVGGALALVMASAAPCRGQFTDLAARVPDGANAIFLIDMEQLMRSPLATRENWRARKQALYDAGLLMVPPEANQVLAAAKLDFETLLSQWQLLVMNLNREPALPQLALRFNGVMDQIGRYSMAVMPGESYFIQMAPRILGFGSPANRQDVGRWVRRFDAGTLAGLSPYLRQAQQFAQQNAHLIIAVDLQDVLCAEEVRAKLDEYESLQGKEIDLDKASQALASIRGIMLGVTVTDQRNGALRVDFDEDISAIQDVIKPLLLEALGNQGMTINEFYDWNVQVREKEVRLSGVLSDGGTRRLLSFLDTPPSLQQAEEQRDQEQTQQQLVQLASQQYFSSITSLLNDLRDDKRNRTTMGQISVFFRNYSRRINRLPVLNVDPELVSFGRWVATSLGEGQIAVTEAAARSQIAQQQVSQGNGMMGMGMDGGGGWGGGGWGGGVMGGAVMGGFHGWGGWCARAADRADLQARARVRTQERVRGNMSANLILQAIEDAAADIRVAMTLKYNVEF